MASLKQIETLWASCEAYLKHIERDDTDSDYFGPINCPCCREWLGDESDILQCRGCPIFESTRYTNCVHTPYETLSDILAEHPEDTIDIRIAVKAEYIYLVKLAIDLSDNYREAM